MTEFDVCTYVTLIQLDTVYILIIKCNLATIRYDYPALND